MSKERKYYEERDVPEKLVEDLMWSQQYDILPQSIVPHDPAEGFREWFASTLPTHHLIIEMKVGRFGITVQAAHDVQTASRMAWIASAERFRKAQ